MRIGVFDSGLGGLTVLRALLQMVPEASYTYLGDTARAPYGSKSPQTIVRYALEAQAFLESKGLDLLVVACNTASSLALEELQRRAKYPVIGTIQPAVSEALTSDSPDTIGVIGTRATIQSRGYELAIHAQRPAVQVVSIPCPLLVPLVEEGILEGPIVDQVLEHYLRGLSERNVQAVILGCTHYPLLTPVLKRFFSPQVRIIECSRAIAHEVAERFSKAPRITPQPPQFYVTDEVSRFNSLATKLLSGIQVEAVSLEELSA